MGININLDIDLIVEGVETAVKLNFANCVSMLQLSLTDMVFYPIIENFKIGEAYASESKIGDIDISGIKKAINMGAKILVPLLNVFLAGGIPFPESLF